MPGRPRPRLPLGGWVALLWCAATAAALRGYSGIPAMPSGLPAQPAPVWVLVAVAVAAGLAASTQARHRPLTVVYLLVGCATVLVLCLGTSGLAGSPDTALTQFLLSADVVLGYLVATRAVWTWFAGLIPVLATQPVSAALRALAGQPDGPGPAGLHLHATAWVAYAVLPALVAGLLGYSVRQARNYARRLSEHAAEQAVVAERLRISRELHDQVAHSVSIIALQAGAAARVLGTQPDRAREAMRAVETTSRDTLSGLRRMLGGLRHPDDGDALQPVPGLADVDRLIAAATAAGVEVGLLWSGDRRPLPADVELSAYRVIQESLTNVVRHSGAAACRVSVAYRPADLAIEVVDDGLAHSSPATGYGLLGLRERVTLLHGTFTAGPRPEGGFRVAVRLPATGAAA
jgi:signal transduction histidine kinase